MHLALLLSCAPLVQDPWTPLPLPSVCRPSALIEGPAELLGADHLPFPEDLPRRADQAQAPVPVTLALRLIDEALRAKNLEARLEATDGRLLVQGDDAAVAQVRAILGELEALETALRMDWTASLVLGDEPTRTWSGSARSGERFPVGMRTSTGYLGNQDVNVASDSGVAEPEMHHALTGATLHVSASRLQAGGAVLEVTLDLADLVALERFDPGTPDLGQLQLPAVATCQVRACGLDQVTIDLAGLPVTAGQARLELTVTPRPAVRSTGFWQVVDVSALTRRARAPLAVDSGRHGFDGRRELVAEEATRFTTGGIASLVDGAFSDTPTLWSEHILFVPTDVDGDPVAATLQLVSALEAGSQAGRLHVQQGALMASFPVLDGHPARIVVGREQRHASEVGSQLAPSTWMPIVEVERVFNGLVLDGVATGPAFRGSIRETTGMVVERVEESVSGLAAVERLQRTQRGSSVELLDSAPEAGVLLPQAPSRPAVLARFQR